MNFLAHFHLAGPEEGVIAGALEGEYFKGTLASTLQHPLNIGIRQHRAIDAFTDAHDEVVELRKHFSVDLRRYAGILIDLSFDHFLSKHWHTFCDTPLEAFSRSVYNALNNRTGQLSDPARRMHTRMLQHNILCLYQDWRTVAQAARNIGGRLKRGNALENVGPELDPLSASIESVFLSFYPQLQAFSDQKLRQLQLEMNHASQ